MKELNQREGKALESIATWKGRYSVCWTPKSNERLKSLGYVTIKGGYVQVTSAGLSALAALEN